MQVLRIKELKYYSQHCTSYVFYDKYLAHGSILIYSKA